jgi:hypothetical protein
MAAILPFLLSVWQAYPGLLPDLRQANKGQATDRAQRHFDS